jgi:membrane associated rhomboid family serine protease
MDRQPSEGMVAKRELVAEMKAHAEILGGFVGLLWVIQIVNALLGGALTRFGVEPRTLSGLVGILFAPFLHASFAHLIANTVPLLVLGWFVMLRKKRDLLTVSVISGLVGGLGTWLIAPALTVHIGASVLIFGYLGYLLARGIFERRFWPILGSIAVFFLYGGALFGVLPGQLGISWQGHLFGLLGGILAARWMRTPELDAPAARPSPARSRIAESGPARVESLPASNDAAAEAEIEAELERVRALVKARSVR